VNGVAAGACGACGWRGFPVPEWCPRCGSDAVRVALAWGGTVEETTILRHAPGRTLPGPVRIGSVRLAGGGVVIARLDPAVGEGSRVLLVDDAGTIRARAARG
jgi:uncharacterized OB-fold protein